MFRCVLRPVFAILTCGPRNILNVPRDYPPEEQKKEECVYGYFPPLHPTDQGLLLRRVTSSHCSLHIRVVSSSCPRIPPQQSQRCTRTECIALLPLVRLEGCSLVTPV